MSLSTMLQDLATVVGTDVKTITNNVGSLASLTTTTKSSLVAAINEVRQAAASATGIDDNTTAATTTWSSTKISAAIAAFAPAWSSITGKPSTYPPTIGTTSVTAKAGNYTPTWSEVTSKPTFAAVATSGSASDLTGTLPSEVLPPLAITSHQVVASQAAMLAVTAQPGDLVTRSDISQTFILAASPASTLANWIEVSGALDGVQSVNGHTGSSVTITKADISLGNVDNTSDANKPISSATQTALNAKAVIGTVAGTAADAGAVGDTTVNLVSIYNTAKA